MVFGIGDGSMEIVLDNDKQSYNLGDKVKGKVVLTLKKKIKAKGLYIELKVNKQETTEVEVRERRSSPIGSQQKPGIRYSYSGGYSSHMEKKTTIKEVYYKRYTLSGPQDYLSGGTEFPFEIQLPNDPSLHTNPDVGPGGKVFGISLNFGKKKNPFAWTLHANLDMPMAFDIGKSKVLDVF